MLAKQYAEYYKIEAQREGESDGEFRGRVSGVLRDMGHIIEAHEASQDARYEDSENVMTGIMGAMAQALQGTNYGSKGERQIDDDFAAGVIVNSPKQDSDPMMALLAALLFGH